MSIIIAATLIIGSLVAAGLVVIGVPVLIGLVTWDLAASRRSESVAPETAEAKSARARTPEAIARRIWVKRSIARAFVILGGTFWGIAVFAGMYSFRQTGMASALLGAFVPFFAILVTLVVGWYYERVTAVALVLASIGVVYWGVTYQFEPGVWVITTVALIGPMLTAAVLFWLARRDQVALDLSLAAHRELAPATISR
ncbi:MAG: hypothetical protein Q8K89_06870 [Actinomycetota bacterium]|nr:hypothetical protein [Actinomycetota bacterium]